MFIRVLLAIAATAAAVGWTLLGTVPAMVDIGLATGLTGAPGTLTVLECHDGSFSRRSRQVCTGSFVYGATGEEVAVRAFSWADPGHVYPAQITDGGDRAGVRGMQGALAALPDLSLGLIFIAMVGMVLRLRAFHLVNVAVIGAVGLVGTAVGLVAQSF
ncbi:hypothetical protein ABZ917_26410 [Nonomuraea wenchangensis]